jgi:hypothetical protein
MLATAPLPPSEPISPGELQAGVYTVIEQVAVRIEREGRGNVVIDI